MLVGATQKLPDGSTGYAEAAIGGTSLASPLLSGLEADSITERDGVPLGFVNPTLYCMARDRDALRDVTDSPQGVQQPIAEVFPPFDGQSAALAGIGQDGALRAQAGYDDATGLGTPGPEFIEELAAE
jgi:subtilase family serine protease